ncbi:MAG: DUF4239 domain-containing protein [Bacteroidetes bacterium]|nr:MAG: DUF4239 domain-containing protein [Bacteroidota bacterium]REJ99738.1 MAG: DUF4239 domain-containing protein [Bacteroidota bacterium]REK32932.1 MAG: DUF4239 domain-containing protein [Bacteroidota bacterium]REK47737.1 MAG: DUF4239 domain-containing protein [Bacteroidota bacterium]
MDLYELIQMPAARFCFVIVLLSIVLAVGGLLFFRKFLNNFYFRSEDNVVANIVIRQISTLLAVMLGFAVITIWQDYELQRSNIGVEASIMGNIYRDSRGMDAETEKNIQSLLVDYTRQVVNDAWPKMKLGQESELSWMAFNKLYGYIIRLNSENTREEIVHSRLVHHLNELAKYRRLRHIRNAEPLIPPMLWGVFYSSTMLILVCGFFLRTGSLRLQTIMTAITGIVFGLIFSMLLLLNYPYRSSMQVSPAPIKNLLEDVYPMASITQNVGGMEKMQANP